MRRHCGDAVALPLSKTLVGPSRPRDAVEICLEQYPPFGYALDNFRNAPLLEVASAPSWQQL